MKFAEIPGNEALKKRMIEQINGGKIPQSQLLIDKQSGTGLALALAFSQYLMCLDRGETDSCGQCSACLKVAKQIHPDLHISFPSYRVKSGEPSSSANFMDKWRSLLDKTHFPNYNQWMNHIDGVSKQTQISKSECRSMIATLGLKTYESAFKVQIIWLAEYLGDAGNVLLKGLEEPTPNTHFLLITEDPDSILPTIYSRSQSMHVQAIGDDILSNWLISEQGAHLELAQQVAFLADGNLSIALEIKDADNSEDVKLFEEWLALISKNAMIPLMNFTDELSTRKKEWLRHFLVGTLSYLRECTIFHYDESYTMRIPGESNGFRERFARFIDHEACDGMHRAINKSLYHIERNANLKIELFHLSLTLREILAKQTLKRKTASSS